MEQAKKHPYHGRMLTIREASKETGLTYQQIINRMNRFGISLEEAVEMKPKRMGKRPQHYVKTDKGLTDKELKVIACWNSGERTPEEVMEITGASRYMVERLIPRYSEGLPDEEDKLTKVERQALCTQISEEGRKIIEKAKGVHKTEGQGVPAAGSEV